MKFKPEDFFNVPCEECEGKEAVLEGAANIANAKLEAWLKEAPMVKQFEAQDVLNEDGAWYDYDAYPRSKVTHQAKLVQIEEIK